MAARWKALRWTDAYLGSTLGNKRVRVHFNDKSTFDYNTSATTGVVKRYTMELREALHLMHSDRGSNFYIQQQSVGEEFPELLTDIDRPMLLDQWRSIDHINVWIGGKGCKTPLHFDGLHNFLVQISGAKKITLFPPDQAVNLYPAKGDLLEHCSRVNVFDPDLAMYPLFAKAKEQVSEFILGAGDGVYIPNGWWHAVESLQPSVSLNYWWHSLI
jgi:hypothetical protein